MRCTAVLTFCLATALSAPFLSAQSFYLPSDTPGTGTANAFPFGTNDMRYQALILASDLNNTPAIITGFAVAPSNTGVRSFRSVTMRMAHLPASVLSTTFDQNLAAGATTTMDVVDWHWHLTANTWNVVDMQQAFLYNGVDNVVVEFIVIGSSGVSGQARRDSSRQRVYRTGYTNQPDGTDGGLTAFKMRLIVGDANIATYGIGCVGSNTLSPTLDLAGTGQLGTSLDVRLGSALPNTPVVLHFGLSTAGPIFPLDLGPLGATGCTMNTDAFVSLGMASDASGNALLSGGVPPFPALTGSTIYFQWICVDGAANALGLTTSNYGRVQVGN